jgi:hypothetical protein
VHAGFPQAAQDQLQQIALALAGVAENENVGVGLVVGAAVEIDEDIAAEFVPAQAEALRVGLAGIVERVQVGGGAGGQHPFELIPEHIPSGGHHRQESPAAGGAGAGPR